jgi:hypothetical protein
MTLQTYDEHPSPKLQERKLPKESCCQRLKLKLNGS